MLSRRASGGVLALLLLSLTAAGSVGGPVAAAAPAEREVAPSFRLRLLDGTTLKSEELEGKVVVLRFLASW